MNSSSTNVEREIMASLKQFVKYLKEKHSIDAENIDLGHFISGHQKNRTFRPVHDTFLHICEFLDWNEMIRFSTLCREYVCDYYPPIWNIIHRRMFPQSIASDMSYVETRTAVSIDYFYHILIDHSFQCHSWFQVLDCEKHMEQYGVLLNTAGAAENDTDMNTYLSEIDTYTIIRDSVISGIDPTLLDFLKTFQFNSARDAFGKKYYTIKPEINVRVYGIDPDKEHLKAYNKKLWMTGVYTDHREYNYDSDDDDEFTYGIDSVTSFRFRYRARPSYC